MKKNNKLMRASGILLVLTLITSCFVGGTFAKYVSDDKATDTARVAKWGVEIDVIGDGFKTAYDGAATTNISGDSVVGKGEETITFEWDTNESTEIDVKNVLAPGTSGTFGGIKITGNPEVAVQINTEANVVLTNWDDGKNNNDNSFYCPLVFTIGDQKICGLHYDGGNGGKYGFERAIEEAIENVTNGTYEAGEDLSDIGKDVTYSWEWPFEDSYHTECDQENESSTSYHERDQEDTLDSKLGTDGESGSVPGILITVTTTVSQAD